MTPGTLVDLIPAIKALQRRELTLIAARQVVDEAIAGNAVDPHRLQWAADIARVRVSTETTR